MSKRFDVLVSRENGERRFWTKIGSAFVNKDESIGIKLDALPLDGNMLLKVPMTKEERDEKFSGGGGQRSGGGGASRYRRGQSQPQAVDGNLFTGRKAPSYPKGSDEAFGADDDDGAFK